MRNAHITPRLAREIVVNDALIYLIGQLVGKKFHLAAMTVGLDHTANLLLQYATIIPVVQAIALKPLVKHLVGLTLHPVAISVVKEHSVRFLLLSVIQILAVLRIAHPQFQLLLVEFLLFLVEQLTVTQMALSVLAQETSVIKTLVAL